METYCIIQVGNKQFCVKEKIVDFIIAGALLLTYQLRLNTKSIDLKIIAKINCKLKPQK